MAQIINALVAINPNVGWTVNGTDFSDPDFLITCSDPDASIPPQDQIEGEMALLDIISARTVKLAGLDNYYYNSNELRIITVNVAYPISMTQDGRSLLLEQVQYLQQQIDLGLKTIDTAIFYYFYNGSYIAINITQLKNLSVTILTIVNSNFVIYKQHIAAIDLLTTVDAINAYDFTANFQKNNTYTI